MQFNGIAFQYVQLKIHKYSTYFSQDLIDQLKRVHFVWSWFSLFCTECLVLCAWRGSSGTKMLQYRMAENFRGRKLSWISRLCGYSQRFSPWNLGMCLSFGAARASNPRKFLHENRTFYQFAKVFSLKIFPLYGRLMMFCALKGCSDYSLTNTLL